MLDDGYDTITTAITTAITNTTTTTTTTTIDDQSHHVEGQSDDSGYRASPQFPSLDFEVLEYKPTPCSIENGASEHLSLSEESPALHILASIPTIKSPIVLLERCDKIWNTLQLIKTIQCNNTTESSSDCDEEEEREETLYPVKIEPTEQTESNSTIQPTLSNDKAVPFSFLIQKTRKLYPCVTCGKQYLERRSLRKHSERVHGVTLPLLIRRKRKNNLKNKMGFYGNNPAALFSKKDHNLEKLHNNKDFNETSITPDAFKHFMTNSLKEPKNMTSDMNFGQSQKNATTSYPSEKSGCALCQQKVKCVRQHLINYHKIGCSSSMIKELEFSIKNRTLPRNDKTMSKSTLSDKLSQISTNVNMQNKSHVMNNESKTREVAQVRKKREYTLSHANARKRSRLDMNRYASIPDATMNKRHNILSNESYKCEICLGIYASANSYAKHRRIHRIRGETKKNFHKFKCRYFNSPLNEKNRLARFSVNSTDNNSMNRDLQSNILEKRMLDDNGKISRINQATMYNAKGNKNTDTTCICGRSFRNPHTLFVHKSQCKLCNDEDDDDDMSQDAARDTNSDKDSGSGINITIKKRNNSYEIVGKDSDEDKLDKPDNATLTTDDNIIKSSVNAHVKQQQLNTYNSSEYSKDHSILKLQNANDENEIIDIEDDVQIISDENDEQIIAHENDKSNLQEKQNNDTESTRTVNKVLTLKQLCQKVLDEMATTRESENAMAYQKTKTDLTSLSKTKQNVKKECAYNEENICMVKIDDISSTCGYCNQQFDTVGLYNKHQCTVKEGKEFNEFSQHLLCLYCSEILSSFNEFDEHMDERHVDSCGHYCYYCPNRFLSDRERRRHCRAEHKDTSCRFCNKKLVVSVKALHEGYHLGFGHPCHRCKKAYSTRKKLLYHNSTIHKIEVENSVLCNVCLRSVKLKTFRSHMYAHKNNECHFCGKVFTNRTGMEYHTLVYHRGTTSKLKCNNCNTRFYNKKQLEKHEKIDRCANYKKIIKKEN